MTTVNDLEVGYDVPALVGMDEADIQTPCLVVDLDALERNIIKMGSYAKEMGVRHRVHGKMHKSVDIALLQEKLGDSCGVCCQKVSEAEEISNKAKSAYEKASNDAKDAATLSLELRENLRQKDIEQKYSDWTYEFQRLNKSIKSANEHIQELTLRKKKSEERKFYCFVRVE